MSVLSLNFVIFLFIALLFYFSSPSKHQWKALLIISYVFYLISGMETIIFLIFTSLVTFYGGKKIGKINYEYQQFIDASKQRGETVPREERQRIKADEDRRKKKIMIILLVVNFGILLILKYSSLVADLIDRIGLIFGAEMHVDTSSWLIPLGISYYTFQSMGYIIDLYRRKYEPEENVFKFMLFVSFFPQLIQGPISRFHELSEQLLAPHKFNYINLKYGIELAIWGLFKKLVISDRIAIMTSTIFASPERYSGLYLVFATVFSMLQLYMDFSGGIDIVRGVGEMFGISLPENFTRPFFARNMGEYWRRWHITLNNWWRDYIFYPLSLSRPLNKFGKKSAAVVGKNFGKKLPILISVIIIRIINSIWHGATGSSILGGLYYGLILAFSFYFEDTFVRLNEKLKINTECFSWKLFQCVRTFCLVAAPRLVSNAKTLSDGGNYFKCLFKTYNPWIFVDGSLYELGVVATQFRVVILGLIVVLIVSALQEKGMVVREKLDSQNIVFRVIFNVIFIYSIILFGVYGAGYDASSFTYAQF